MPFFSIIIPLYNKESHIENTLKSVFNQSFTDYEILIVNDGSTDKSEEIVLGFSDSRIKILNQKNQGVSAARNLGITNSLGKLIAFLDADDYWFEDHLEVLKQLYHDFPNAGMFCSRYKIKFAEKHYYKPKLMAINDDFRGIVNDFFGSSIKYRIAWTSIVAIPKPILDDIGLFNITISSGQDLDLWIRIAIKHSVAITNKITAIYHFEIDNSLAKTNILNKKIIDFNPFEENEKLNSSLKNFLDIYRLEYGLHYYMFGAKEKSKYYLNKINPQNITFKTKILLKLPPFVLRVLLKMKHFLKRNGINFSIYN